MENISLNQRIESKTQNSKLVKKTVEIKKQDVKKSNVLLDIINDIKKDVDNNLNEYKELYQIIYDLNEFEYFINQANKIGYIAIDIKTSGRNPLEDKLIGLSFLVPGEKPTYVPINHVDYITGERYKEQISEDQIKVILDKLTAKIIMFEASFNIRVIRHTIGTYLTCYWDISIAAKCMNENVSNDSVKELYKRYILRNKNKKEFNDMFENIMFNRIPIEYAYLYAAHNIEMIYELYNFQSYFLNANSRKDLADVYNLFMNIEMPVIDVVCDMEDTGVMLDINYTLNYLLPKYKAILNETLSICREEIDKHIKEIEDYNKQHLDNKLILPINLDSPTQLAIFLYDILKISVKDKKQSRGTSEEILLKINNKFTKALLDYRSAQKLLKSYIEKMPNIVQKDGRIHCHYNQYGAKTGRFSSTDPNMQNIPSDNDEIRKMFIGGTINKDIEDENGVFKFDKSQEVEVEDGKWVFVEKLNVGDCLLSDVGYVIIIKKKVEPGLTGKVWFRVQPQ